MNTILKCRRQRPSRQIVRQMMRLSHCLFLVTILAGCGLGGKPSYLIKQYVIEYPSPRAEGLAQGNELLKVERFSVAREYDTQAMIYRDGPFQRGVDPYNRWRVNPGDMVTDHLLRDLRKAGLFKAVFSYNDNEVTRYLLEGQVIEFLESREKEGLKAVLGLNVTLQDLTKREIPERIVFQRNYRSVEPLETVTYEGLAQAMSNAMEKISGQLMTDLSKAIRESKK
jgi:uncharacterized lipoprotein YmbA